MNEKVKIYFISGLGADKRVFGRLAFAADFELIYLDWIAPQPAESLESYADRLSLGINTSAAFYLVGLSFGGMLATEIARKLSPLHTFIISSVAVHNQLPWYYRLAGSFRLHQIISVSLAKRASPIMYKLFGLKTRSEKSLMDQIIADTDPVFLKWALTCILGWKNTIKPARLTHIHGTADKILPIKYTKPDIVVENGGHFMVYTHAKVISKLVGAILARCPGESR